MWRCGIIPCHVEVQRATVWRTMRSQALFYKEMRGHRHVAVNVTPELILLRKRDGTGCWRKVQNKIKFTPGGKKHITSSVYDCTVEDVEYHNVAIVTHIRHLVTARHGYAVTSSTLLADPPIKRNHRCILHQNTWKCKEPGISTDWVPTSSVRILNQRDKYVNFIAGNTGLLEKQTSSAAPDSTKVNSRVHLKYEGWLISKVSNCMK